MSTRAEDLQEKYEPRPNPQELTGNEDPALDSSSGVDYEPHPERSIPVSPEREHILQSITNLYSGSASEEDMQVYAEEAIYDDPWSYCDTRYKIAGQWYGTCVNKSLLLTSMPSSHRKPNDQKKKKKQTY